MGKTAKIITTLLSLLIIIISFLAYIKEDVLNLIIQFQPPTYIYYLFGLLFVGMALLNFYQSGWEEAKPNEWLVIVQNGEQIKSGIGLICFKPFYQTAIKFPSSVQKVQFNAMQVCQEMQGLKLSGFAIWSVHREQPFLYYRQMHGSNANQSIKMICESIVRHQIANTDLENVMTQREKLRDSMKEDLQKILSGWGVWLETVEITEVTICSNSLFQDMQTPSKQQNYLTSELYKMKINNEMDINRKKSNFEITKNKEQKETERLQHYYKQELRRIKQEQEYQKQKFQFEKQSIQQQSDIDIQQIKNNHEVELEQVKNSLKNDSIQKEQERNELQQNIEAEQQMSEINLEKYKLAKLKELYQSVPIQNIKINSYSSQENQDLSSILPSILSKK